MSLFSLYTFFFGGIPSGQSVRCTPLKLKVIDLIFVGLNTRMYSDPRSKVGGRDSYS